MADVVQVRVGDPAGDTVTRVGWVVQTSILRGNERQKVIRNRAAPALYGVTLI
ncbi:hypothetical protein [Streptomyces sp. NPDC003401]